MSANLLPCVPGRQNDHRLAGVVQGLLVATGLLLLSFPAYAGGQRGGGGGGSHGGSHGSSSGGGSHSGGSHGNSGGGHSYSSSGSRGAYGGHGGGAYGGSSHGGSYHGGAYHGGAYHGGAYHGGAYHGGAYHGGAYHGGGYYGGHHGWYCPPTYYAGWSNYWGGPWDWWWGWGPYWGLGGYGGWGGGVYVVNDGTPAGNQYARVDTDVSPEAAEVYLDGTLIGQADDFDGFPDYLYLEPGKYRLEFRHPYYETVVKELDVRAGQAIQMNDEMKLLPGKKKLQVVDPESKGTPLGRVFGRPETKRDGIDGDRTGRYDVKAGPDDGFDVSGDVRPPVPPPAGPNVSGVAPADRSRLRFEVEPGDAAVYLDDRYIGTGEELGDLNRGFPAKPGKHVVSVLRPGFKSKTVEIETKPGAAIDIVIELEK